MNRLALLLVALAALAALMTLATPAEAQVRPHGCDYCHNLHGSTGSVPLTDYGLDVDLCMSCHDDAAPATYDGKTVPKGVAVHAGSKHSVGDETTCTDCHDHYGSADTNLSLIPRTLESRYTGTKTVVFTARTGVNSFADGDTTYDGVCEVCHTLTDQHRADGSAPQHNAQADCTTCHSHADGFTPSGGCTACHNQSQGGRRVVVSEFDYTSHHVDWAGAGYASAQDIPDSDCQTCHEMSQHQQGSVRLKNADDGGIVYSLTGDPLTNSAEAATLTPFCLSCHDADAAGGALPFSDGATPPVIDSAAWTASSHNASAAVAGCFGNGAFGCHSTGHGSQKTRLLAPFDVAATAPALTEQEEGFCFNCHDATGPATSDMDSLYALPSNYVEYGTGILDNPNFNDRHDVQQADQAISGAVIECVDCHDPHTATAAQPFRSDPDTANAPTITAMSSLSLFCLDCHDGTYAAGVTPPTNTLVNIDDTWANTDVMGFQTGGPDLSTQTGGWSAGVVMECDDCHSPHPSPTYSGAFAQTNFWGLKTPALGPTGEPLEGWSDTTGDWTVTDYSYSTLDTSKKDDRTLDNGSIYCNSCHARDGMIGKSDCTNCHAHGDGRF